jgi:glycosyltransferase involved in cell wall biosynthesis
MITISAIIPCYNRVKTIGEAIASVYAQTRAPIELIVVDDASADGSAAVAERCGARVIRLSSNSGSSTARNVGIRAAAGDAIAWLDSDDFWEPHHLATIAALLDRYPDAAVAGGAVRLVGLRSGIWYGRVPEGPPANVLDKAFYATAVHSIAAIVRRDALLDVGGFDETESYAEDFDLWLRLSRRHSFVASREVTANYRWHGTQTSSNPVPPLLAMYGCRKRLLDAIVRDGETDIAERVAVIFRNRWLGDLQTAWDENQPALLRDLLALAPLVPDPPRALKRKWTRRSRIPAPVVPLLRACRARLSSSHRELA